MSASIDLAVGSTLSQLEMEVDSKLAIAPWDFGIDRRHWEMMSSAEKANDLHLHRALFKLLSCIAPYGTFSRDVTYPNIPSSDRQTMINSGVDLRSKLYCILLVHAGKLLPKNGGPPEPNAAPLVISGDLVHTMEVCTMFCITQGILSESPARAAYLRFVDDAEGTQLVQSPLPREDGVVDDLPTTTKTIRPSVKPRMGDLSSRLSEDIPGVLKYAVLEAGPVQIVLDVLRACERASEGWSVTVKPYRIFMSNEKMREHATRYLQAHGWRYEVTPATSVCGGAPVCTLDGRRVQLDVEVMLASAIDPLFELSSSFRMLVTPVGLLIKLIALVAIIIMLILGAVGAIVVGAVYLALGGKRRR